MRDASTLSLVSMVECLVNLTKMMMAHPMSTTDMRVKSAKPPTAHLATNQNREAKQKSAEGTKKVTSPMTSSSVVQTAKQMATVHFPRFGNGLVRRPRMVSSSPKMSCKKGTMNIPVILLDVCIGSSDSCMMLTWEHER